MHRFILTMTGLFLLQACREPVKTPGAEAPSTTRALPAAPGFVFSTGQPALDSMANRFETLLFNAKKSKDHQASDSLLLNYMNFLYHSSETDTSNSCNNRLQSIAQQIIDSATGNPGSRQSKSLTRALEERAFYLVDCFQYHQAGQYINQYLQREDAETGVSKSLSGRLGDIYVRWGDNRKGMEYLLESYRYFKKQLDNKSRQKAANNCVSIANNYNQLGNYGNALAFVDSGLAVIAGLKNDTGLTHEARIRFLGVKAETFLKMKALATAEKFAKQAIEMNPRDKSGNIVWPDLLAEDLDILGKIRVEERNFREAKAFFSEAVQSMKTSNGGSDSTRETGKLYNSLGQVYDSLAIPDSALHYYHLALAATVTSVNRADLFDLPQPDSLYAENTIMESLDKKASAFEKKFRQTNDPRFLQSALRCYELAFKVAALLMQQYKYDEAKLSMSADSRRRTEKALGDCFELYRMKVPGNWVEMALQMEENSKAILLLETVHDNFFLSVNRGQSAAGDSILQLRLQLKLIKRDKQEENLSADSAYLENEEKRIDKALNAYRNNGAYQYYFNESFQPGSDLSFNQIRKELLPGGSALIEYFIGDSAAYALALGSNGKAEMIELSPLALIAVDSLRKLFGDPRFMNKNPIPYQYAAYRTWHLILQPLTVATSARSLIIVPDGAISYLPFDGLVTSPADSVNNWRKLPYLVNRYDITQGYSTATLLQQAAMPGTYPPKALGFAPVHFAGADSLHYSLPELKALEQYLKGNFYTEAKATRNQFNRDLAADSFEVVHFATHAYGDTGSSRQPFLLFSSDSLKLDELYRLSVKARLVVLSACQTAIGELQSTEGPMNLARGFIYAGARELITSLWNANDRSTAELFTHFYKNAGKHDYTRSLQMAKLDYLNTRDMDNEKYAPYYWAGFIKMGISRPRSPGSNSWLWWMAGLLAVAGLWLIFRKKK